MRDDDGRSRIDPPTGKAVVGGARLLGKDPVSGRKQYVTKTIRGERREAEVALGRMLGEIEDGQYAVRAGTVGDLCEKWFAQAEPDLSPSVGPEYHRLLDNRILPRWGNVPAPQAPHR